MSQLDRPVDDLPAAGTTEHCAALLAALAAPDAHRLQALPRTTVVVAHPDDETVGAGSRLPRLKDARFVYVTDGAPRDGQDAARHGYTPAEYANARRREIEAALALCGIGPGQVLGLGCPDQQASLQLGRLAARLAEVFAQWRPEAVLTLPYEGGHPDHDATAFVVHAAAALMRGRGQPAPCVVEFALYHLGSQGTPACAFLPDADADADAGMAAVHLTAPEQQHKLALLACFVTQQDTLRNLPIDVERFRRSPLYDFGRLPHAGKLYYERHPWGMTGARFCQLAANAMAELRLEGLL
jgi:N-acetylglucosamine malate deacetylase 2